MLKNQTGSATVGHVFIRDAKLNETDQILSLMRELAEFEGYIKAFNVTEEDLKKRCFEEGDFSILVAQVGSKVEGILVYYTLPFTYDLAPWMFIKELYISVECRSLGLGKQLMQAAANACKRKGASKMCWQVLADNDAAQGFYRGLGAQKDPLWENFKLAGDALSALAYLGEEK